MDSNITALCSDFYLNQKIALTMDVPEGRESVLDLFERIQREFPRLERLKRYEGECALESEDTDGTYSWVALRQTTLRSGTVNPASLEESYKLHRKILEIAPYFLSVSRSISIISNWCSASTSRPIGIATRSSSKRFCPIHLLPISWIEIGSDWWRHSHSSESHSMTTRECRRSSK